jgi:acetate kinase
MSRAIAVINAGSSSIKFALFGDEPEAPLLFRGQIENIGLATRLKVDDAKGERLAERSWMAGEIDHKAATAILLSTAIELLHGKEVRGVAHRVVHGGTRFSAPVLIDAEIIGALAGLARLAPLHQPHNLAPIRAIAEAAPHIRQIACFDTAFHASQPALSKLYALPRDLTEAGIRRYGFHGLSYEYVSGRLPTLAPTLAAGRTIVAHLGNGASLCALREGRSVATTMGFTAAEGLVMGTRCGSIDPGVLIYLMDEHGMDARKLEDLVYRKSGLLGVSGLSSDMRSLRESRQAAAAEAIALFVYRIVREIGSLAAALRGVDGLVFTGGIGANDAATRSEVSAGCSWLGAVLGDGQDGSGERLISAHESKLEMWVIPTDEERMIARHALRLLSPA